MSTATETKKTTKAAAEDNPHGISDTVVSLAKLMQQSGELKDGKFELSADFVKDNLPPDVSEASFKRHSQVRAEFIAAGALALSNVAGQDFKKHKDHDTASLRFKLGRDTVDVDYDRVREFNDGKGGKVKKLGHVSVGFTAAGATPTGDLGKVRKHSNDEATRLFG
jgi:hypothetical protein